MQGATESTALNLVLSLHTNMEFVCLLGCRSKKQSSSELSTYLTVIGLLPHADHEHGPVAVSHATRGGG
jgi:hypothetical protein